MRSPILPTCCPISSSRAACSKADRSGPFGLDRGFRQSWRWPAAHIAIVPQGGNTGLVGGQVPDRSGTGHRNMRRMNRIREIDVLSNTITVEAGRSCRMSGSKRRRLFPLACQQGSCQIGGNLSSNASGRVLAYGGARSLPRPRSGPSDGRVLDDHASCARTIPAMICEACLSAQKARSASSPRPCWTVSFRGHGRRLGQGGLCASGARPVTGLRNGWDRR